MKKYIVVLMGLVCFSCSKEGIDWTSNNDNSFAEMAFGDIYRQMNRLLESNGDLRDTCAALALDTTTGSYYPIRMTVDYGDHCLGLDNRSRTGKIVLVCSDNWRQPGAQVLVTLQDYRLNGTKIQGEMVLLNNGWNNQQHLLYSLQLTNGKLILVQNDTIYWDRNTTHEWIYGTETTFVTHGQNGVLDDMWLVWGDGNGRTSDGEAYTFHIAKDLQMEIGCIWDYSAGRIEVQPEAGATRFVDFGEGECDSLLLVGKGAFTRKISF